MAYKGLAAFEADAEHDVSMKVNPCRRAKWTVAVEAAEQAIGLERLERVHLLTYLNDSMPQKAASCPKKLLKRPYHRRKSAKTSAVGNDEKAMDVSAASSDLASPPRKRYRRKSSLASQDGAADVPSSSANCDDDVKNIPSESVLPAEKNSTGNLLFYFTFHYLF